MTGMEPIARIHTDLPQKFGIPRNSFLAPHLQGRIFFEPEFASNAAVEGLDSFSHLWLLWRFENGTPGGTAKDIAVDAKTQDRSGTNAKWSKTVRPPRLGGAERVGVFATRSPFRPNPIGMSLVELKGIRCQKDQVILELGSLDLVDGTPVVDIKPYLPFAEALPDASASYAQQAPLAGMNVSFTPEIDAQLLTLEKRYPHIKAFIREVLAQDPRPAYRKEEQAGKTYAVWLLDFNVRWRVIASGFEVFALEAR